MSPVKISVVIPAYNAAPFLPRCLESVFAQTADPAEVIVVDDGSTDDTAALARQIGAKVVSRPNGGLAAARNTGICEATGNWVALLDADDLWTARKLERQIALLRPDVVLAYTGVRIFCDAGVIKDRLANCIEVNRVLRYGNPIAPSSVLVNRDAVLQAGGFREDLRACEDWDMWFRLQPLGSFVAAPEALTLYYVHPSSLSANPDRMLQALDQILDSTLLAGLHGLERWTWRQRIRAAQLCSAGLIARDNHLKSELRYMLRSLSCWPSPFWQPRRFAVFAVSARNSLRRMEEAL